MKSLAAAGGGERHRRRGRAGGKNGPVCLAAEGVSSGIERGTGQPDGGSHSTLTQSTPFNGPLAQGSN